MRIITSLYAWLLKFLELQLFITVCSLPIFTYWGLPISIMTLVGNLIFSPILTIFIFLSAIIFFTELFFIPNTLCIQALDLVTQWWLNILSYGNKSWLIGLKQDYFLFSIIPFIAAFAIVKCRIKREYKVLALLCLTTSTTFILHSFPYSNDDVIELPSGKKKVTLFTHQHGIIVYENGTFSKKSARSFIKYTLLPAMLKKTGKADIDLIIVNTITKTFLDSLKFAHSLMNIKQIQYKKKINKWWLKKDLENFCQENKILLKQNALFMNKIK